MAEDPVKRSYRSPQRAEDARATARRIREAARTLFLEHGYAGTALSAVARAAGVADRTVYLAYDGKAELLSTVVREAVRGTDADVPLRESESWAAMLAAPDTELLQQFAVLTERLMRRSARLLSIAFGAVASSPDLAAYRDRVLVAERAGYRALAAELRERGLLRPGLDVEGAADVIYALASESVYLRLVEDRSWDGVRYVEWLASTLTGALLNWS